jgi:hypothetical protein
MNVCVMNVCVLKHTRTCGLVLTDRENHKRRPTRNAHFCLVKRACELWCCAIRAGCLVNVRFLDEISSLKRFILVTWRTFSSVGSVFLAAETRVQPAWLPRYFHQSASAAPNYRPISSLREGNVRSRAAAPYISAPKDCPAVIVCSTHSTLQQAPCHPKSVPREPRRQAKPRLRAPGTRRGDAAGRSHTASTSTKS